MPLISANENVESFFCLHWRIKLYDIAVSHTTQDVLFKVGLQTKNISSLGAIIPTLRRSYKVQFHDVWNMAMDMANFKMVAIDKIL